MEDVAKISSAPPLAEYSRRRHSPSTNLSPCSYGAYASGFIERRHWASQSSNSKGACQEAGHNARECAACLTESGEEGEEDDEVDEDEVSDSSD